MSSGPASAKEPVPVLCAANSGFIMPLCVMLASLVTHFDRSRSLVIHIIENNFSDRDREDVRKTLVMNRPSLENIEVVWHPVDPSLLKGDMPAHRRITADALSRLFAPTLLPHLDRIIYLDCDLVVLTDLSELYDSITDDAPVHAVHEVSVPFVSSRHGIADYEARGLRAEARVFNSGVLHMNLKRWRRENISGRAFDFLRHQPSLVYFMDQAALNAVMADQWGVLDHRWNQSWTILFPNLWNLKDCLKSDWQKAFKQPRIVHFAGDNKPWNRCPLAPRTSFFFKFLKRTPFRGTVRKGFAAHLEGLIGFHAYFHVWRAMRRISNRLRGLVEPIHAPQVVPPPSPLIAGRPAVPVLCAANSSYLMPLCVMLGSLVFHFDPARQLILHIVGNDFSEKDREKVRQTIEMNRPGLANVEIVWNHLEPAMITADLPQHERLSADAFTRLFAPSLLPHLDRVLYLDCDLVIRHDLSTLYDGADTSASICAVHELSIPLVSSPLGVGDYQALGLSAQARCFNSGVMMINLQRWRVENTSEEILSYLRRNGQKVYLLDQGAMNAILAEKWAPLALTFNQSWTVLFPSMWTRLGYSLEEWRAVRDDAAIVHFAGNHKPWNRDNFAPRSSFFFHYLKNTPFEGTVEKGLAATLEGLIGFKNYYFIWSVGRHIACWLKDKSFEQS